MLSSASAVGSMGSNCVQRMLICKFLPIVFPCQVVIGRQHWFKEFQGCSSKMSKGESDFSVIFGVCGVVLEIEITKEYEVVELLRVRTVKGIRLFCL